MLGDSVTCGEHLTATRCQRVGSVNVRMNSHEVDELLNSVTPSVSQVNPGDTGPTIYSGPVEWMAEGLPGSVPQEANSAASLFPTENAPGANQKTDRPASPY